MSEDYPELDERSSYVSVHDDAYEKMKLVFIGGIIVAAMIGLAFWIMSLRGGISHQEYLRIQDGMTYEEVLSIAGEAPSSISSATVMGVTIDQYNWSGEGPTGLTQIGFMDGRVVSKTML